MKATWPSLALGSLKSFLGAHGVPSRACHLHLEAAACLGLSRYDALADTWGAGEALFGALIEPSEAPRLLALAGERLRAANRPEAAAWVESTAAPEVAAVVEAWLDRERPEEYDVVGASVGALQLCGALYVLKRVRERGHRGPRVLGGSGLVGSVAREVLKRCADVDGVVDGEGERALLALVSARAAGAGLTGVPGILLRDGAGGVAAGPRPEPVDLSSSPPPDLEEFFATAAELGVPRTALTISLEHSRGCAWEHRTGTELRGCTFCGLYRTSPNFRRKPVDRVVAELSAAIQRHQVLNVAFVDAYIPNEYRRDLLEGLARIPSDLTFFTELRCDLDRATAESLARAGAGHVQLGVESFSTPILRHIGKGVDGIQTAYSLRLCQEQGLSTQYNLMVRIPGVGRADIEQLAATLPVLYGLRPPQVVDFYLDRNSLAHADPVAHGIDPDSLDAERPDWLPASLGDSRVTQVVPFRPLDGETEEAWRGLERRVEEWRARWKAARAARVDSPLSWRDGGGWACVTDTRGEEPRIYVLEGLLYEAFRACADVMTEARLARLLPQHPREALARALETLGRHGLVLRDGPRCVAVAVRAGLPPRPRLEERVLSGGAI